MAGRPEILKTNPEVGTNICMLVREGITIGAACAANGISRSVIYKWKGLAAQGVEPYATFADDLSAALGNAEVDITRNVVKRAAEDWRAGAWWLERRASSDYGQKITVQTEVKDAFAELLGEFVDALAKLRDTEELTQKEYGACIRALESVLPPESGMAPEEARIQGL